jgi:lysophospholipase L1-like esterase
MSEQKMSTGKKAVFYLLLIGTPFVFAEVMVRAYFATQIGPRVLLYGTMFSKDQERFDPKGAAWRKAEEESTVSFHHNATLNYTKYYPNQRLFDRDEFDKRFDVTINSHGFRGKDFEQKKRPGVIRVITLGSSSTFGFRSRDDQTYPIYLQQMLNDALPAIVAARRAGDPVAGFEVINMGVPHLTSDQIVSLFMNEGLELEPDFVTFYEGINDAAWKRPPDTTTEKTKQAVKAVPLANEVFRAMRYRLLSVALIGTLISKYKSDYTEADIAGFRDGRKERFIANLQSIREACHRRNIGFIVANQQATAMERQPGIQGLRYEAEQSALREKLAKNGHLTAGEVYFLMHKELMDAEREWASMNGVPYADVIDAMDLNRQYLVTWVHLNAAGNRVVASVLAREILKQLTRDGSTRGKEALATGGQN